MDYYTDMRPMLIKLAQRKGSEEPSWVKWNYSTPKTSASIQCMICDQLIPMMDILPHGLQHLQEHNLLPFI